jgi:hypothetical protein
MSDTDPTKNLGVNPGAHQGEAVPASYKTPAVLLKMYVHIRWIYATYVLLHVLGFNTKYILPLFSGRGWLI